VSKTTVAALRDDGVRVHLGTQGIEAIGSTPAELAIHLRAERERWGRIIREEGIKLE
jgi:tripartite-type tricarboxylate transporter receptor subunit TctC